MIIVKINQENFEYDIHSLVKAFFPAEAVLVTKELQKEVSSVGYFLVVDYHNTKIELNFYHVLSQQISFHKIWKDMDIKYLKRLGNLEIFITGLSRTEIKNKLKQGLYQLLSEYTHQELPWGTLTGIRPVKIPMAFLEQGKTLDEIHDYMKRTYLVSDEKINLSMEIGKTELSILSDIDVSHGYSLYIGIPFCPSTCLYCSFTSYPIDLWDSKIDEYLDALEKEIDFVSEKFSNKKLNTIYIGGGTPTSLTPIQLEQLLNKIRTSFDFSYLLEYTVEAGRPDSITEDKLLVLKRYGITRISINPQTMNQVTLDVIGRKHTVSETIESYYLARKIGFDNINMDLIIGLMGENIQDIRYTLEEVKKLNPDSLTIHTLAIKRGSKLNSLIHEQPDFNISTSNSDEIMKLAADTAQELDMVPYYLYRQKNMVGNYENIGYSKNLKSGIYNILIMEEKQSIIALGAGAITKMVTKGPNNNIERIENVKDIKNYLERIDEMIDRKRLFINH